MPTWTFAAVLLLQSAPLPEVEVEPVGERAYRLSVTLEGVTNPDAAQVMLIPTALRLCGSEPYLFGRYSFSAREALSRGASTAHAESVTLVQALTCGEIESAPAPASAPLTPLTATDLESLDPIILDLTERYFSAITEARHADSLAMTSEEMTGGASLADWTRTLERRRSQTGEPVSRQVARLTWYMNPPGAPSGYYAAADYVATWERQDECGYLMWFSPDGATPFTLVRQEQTLLDHQLDDAERAAARQRFCILL